MSKQTRKLGAALALGFAGGVAAPLVIYVALLHLGAPRAEARPVQQLRLEIEPSTPPAVAVVTEGRAVIPTPAAKLAHRPQRRAAAAAEPEEILVPRANAASLGRHVPTAPDVPR